MAQFDDIDIFAGPERDMMGVPITGSSRDRQLDALEGMARQRYIDPVENRAKDMVKMQVAEALSSVPGIKGEAISSIIALADSQNPDDKLMFNQIVSRLDLPVDVRRMGDDYAVSKRFEDVLGDNSSVGVSAYLPDEGDDQYSLSAEKRFPNFLGGEARVGGNISTGGDPEIRASFMRRFAEGGDVDIFEDQDIPADMYRRDGSIKSAEGYLGPVTNKNDGKTMTELSIGVQIDGREVEIPAMVPTLSESEIEMLRNIRVGIDPIPRSIQQKAVEHARPFLEAGESPFFKGYANGGDVDIFDRTASMMNPLGPVPSMDRPMLSPAQLANIAGGFAPGAGAVEMSGGAPEYPDYDITTGEMITGPRSPSMAEDFDSGEYLSGALKGLGGLGDVLSVVPFVGPVASGILKTPLAVQKILNAGESLSAGLSRTKKSFERGETGAREEYLTLRNARDELGDDFIDEGIGSLTATKGSGDDVSYRMMHSPTTPDSGAARLDDMTGGGNVFPDDVYSSKGLQYYGDPSNKADQESFKVIQSVRGDPDAEVTLYRAVPKGVTEINPGDFVSLSPEYAKMHGESGYGAMGDEVGDVISMKVKVKEVFSDGNDLNEFGFFPMERLQRAKDAGFDTDNVYYHGADADIEEFRMPSRETGQTKTVGTGVFMSSSPEVAGSYSRGENAVLYPVYINKAKFLKIRPTSKGQFC